jgi:hypothetical protein
MDFALRVGPELAEPVGALEVRQHEDVEQLGAWGRPERVKANSEPALDLVGTHEGER